MATTMFFEKTITDKEDKNAKLDLEFGRSSYYGTSLIYINVNGTSVIVDETTGRSIYDAMQDLGAYLGYDK